MRGYFAIIEDPRHPSYVRHSLVDILIMVMCSVLCGMTDLCGIVSFAQNKAEFLKKHFGIEKIPSKPTFSRVLALVDGQKVAETIMAVMQDKFGIQSDVIAIDGKAIRSTSEPNKKHSALQIITAYLTETGVVLGQKKINKKTNEIPVLKEMLSYLNIEGKTVTADAIHCQRETCAQIVAQKGDYVIGLKNNQKNLLEDVEFFINETNDKEEIEEYTTLEKNHGRIEKRICKKIISGEWLKERHNWPGLKTAFSIERIITKGNKTSNETGYYITSSDKSAQSLSQIAREHWRIESMHWVLDVLFSEDDTKYYSENAHISLNTLRKFAFQIHKNYIKVKGKKCSVKNHILNCLLNENLLLDIISTT